MDTHSVYILTYPNGKFYIGCTGDIENRILSHMNPSSGCATSKMCEQYSKEDVDVNLVFSSTDLEKARSVEGKLIHTFYDFDDCLNLRDPIGISTKVNKKISETLKLRHQQGRYDSKLTANQQGIS